MTEVRSIKTLSQNLAPIGDDKRGGFTTFKSLYRKRAATPCSCTHLAYSRFRYISNDVGPGQEISLVFSGTPRSVMPPRTLIREVIGCNRGLCILV